MNNGLYECPYSLANIHIFKHQDNQYYKLKLSIHKNAYISYAILYLNDYCIP